MAPARKEIDTSTFVGRFAQRIRKQRLKLGLTAQEIVEKMEKKNHPMSLNSYYKWETAQRDPVWNALPALASVLKFKDVREMMPRK